MKNLHEIGLERAKRKRVNSLIHRDYAETTELMMDVIQRNELVGQLFESGLKLGLGYTDVLEKIIVRLDLELRRYEMTYEPNPRGENKGRRKND